MIKYKVIWTKKAEDNLKEIGDWLTAENIQERVENHLASHPLQNSRPMWGKWQGFHRYRFNDYRVIFEINERVLMITVVKVGHRQEVYLK